MMTQAHADLRQLNTFGIAAKAAVLVMAGKTADLDALAATPGFETRDWAVLGGGSNILFTGDVNRPVVRIAIPGLKVVAEAGQRILIEAGAGVVWHKLVMWSLDQGLSGLENLSLIPGTVGAAPIQNIGAYGVELRDVFDSLEAWHIADGRVRTYAAADCAFGYRDSVFKRDLKGACIITKVRFALRRNGPVNIEYGAIRDVLKERGIGSPSPRDVAEAVMAIRRSKLPDPAHIGNAGSFFKNPTLPIKAYEALKTAHPDMPGYLSNGGMKVPAGWLIEQAGWKGFRDGDAGVHAKQALVLVNHGQATGAEIRALSDRIRADIRERYGIDLETEVNIW
jgi:UDP-N-acetylmuramate dehydrogenase